MANIFVGNDKKNLVLVGDGMGKTIILGNKSRDRGFGTYETMPLGKFTSLSFKLNSKSLI